jgi:large subunit ribosomal protein L4
MTTIDLQDVSGKKTGTVDLDDNVFGIEPNIAVMHQVVTAQLAARRSGTHSTKTRAEVAGGGRKPYKQKGTGNARQGSTRAPQWKGGGVALGPRPRNYEQRTPKKMVRLALHSALSDRAAEGKVVVVDDWGWDKPRTKDALAALAALGIDGKVLVVVQRSELNVALSFRNLQHVHVLEVGELNAYDVLCSDVVVFTRATLPVAEPMGKAARRAQAQPAADEPEAEATAEADVEAVDADATAEEAEVDESPAAEPVEPAPKKTAARKRAAASEADDAEAEA